MNRKTARALWAVYSLLAALVLRVAGTGNAEIDGLLQDVADAITEGEGS